MRERGQGVIAMFLMAFTVVLMFLVIMHISNTHTSNTNVRDVVTYSQLISSNITPAHMSFKTFEYEETKTLFTREVKQRYPVVNATFQEIVRVAEKTGVIYYDEEHLFVPAKADHNATAVYVWKIPGGAERIISVSASDGKLSVRVLFKN